MANDPQSALKIPLILVVLGLIGYVGTSYYTQRQEFASVRSDLENAKKGFSENLNILQQQSEQRFAMLQKLTEDFEVIQKRLTEMDQAAQAEKKESAQLILAQQESIRLLKEQQAVLVKGLAQNEMEIKESKEVQAQMIPTALETRKLQTQIDTLNNLQESLSVRMTNLQEQISTRNSMHNQASPTKNPNPLRNGFP